MKEKISIMKEKISMVNMMLVNAQIADDKHLVAYLRNKLSDLIAMYKKELVVNEH